MLSDLIDKIGTAPQVNSPREGKGLPVADPFQSIELHRGAGTKFVGTVVADLYDVAGFVSAEEDGFGRKTSG